MKKCPVCLVERCGKDYAFCSECNTALKKENDAYTFLAECSFGFSNQSITFAGVEFSIDNWQDHPAVVMRRLKEGTETRRIVSNVYNDNFEPATVEGDEIWSRMDNGQKGASYKNYKKHWNFTRPQDATQSTTIEDNRYTDTCPYCGAPAYHGLVWDCSKCDGRY
jgi:hypothetical protein